MPVSLKIPWLVVTCRQWTGSFRAQQGKKRSRSETDESNETEAKRQKIQSGWKFSFAPGVLNKV